MKLKEGDIVKNKKWNDKEYNVTIKAYCQLWLDQKNGKPINVVQAAKKCSTALNNSRTPRAIRMRFGNISHVFSIHNLEIVENVQVLKNISPDCAEYIWETIKTIIGKATLK